MLRGLMNASGQNVGNAVTRKAKDAHRASDLTELN